MDLITLPLKVLEVLVRDAAKRDLATARRAALVKILLHERCLTREQLIVRVEGLQGKGCFGSSAWEDVFYRDMRIVKAALKAGGYGLRYGRSPDHSGYFLQGQPPVSAELSEILRKSVADVDSAQIQIIRGMTPAQRYRLGCSMTDTALQAVAFRIQQNHPELALSEASYYALQGKPPRE